MTSDGKTQPIRVSPGTSGESGPTALRSLQEIQILMDGTRSNLSIAEELGISFQFVDRFATALEERDLAVDTGALPGIAGNS